MPEAEAFEIAGRKHGVPSTAVHDAVKHVQDVLLKNNWFASPDAEIGTLLIGTVRRGSHFFKYLRQHQPRTDNRLRGMRACMLLRGGKS